MSGSDEYIKDLLQQEEWKKKISVEFLCYNF
jgi:hypothetical protein